MLPLIRICIYALTLERCGFSNERIKKVEDVLKVGDDILVKVTEIGKDDGKFSLTAKDLMQIIPKLSYNMALKYIDNARCEMSEKGYFLPEGKTKVALTKIIKKKFGL